MKIFSRRLTLIALAATSLIFYPEASSAMTVDVTVGPGGQLVFSPSSVTIRYYDGQRPDVYDPYPDRPRYRYN
jgi:hypothetical protein